MNLHAIVQTHSRRYHRVDEVLISTQVAAGIGRVAKHVLLPFGAASVDVLEPARTLREAYGTRKRILVTESRDHSTM